jgi:hypothetical protein
LNKNGKNRHPCLVPDFDANVFNFPLFSMILAIALSYTAYIV